MKFREKLLAKLDAVQVLNSTLDRMDHNNKRWLYFNSENMVLLDNVCRLYAGATTSMKPSRHKVYTIECFCVSSMVYPSVVAEFLSEDKRDKCYQDLCNWVTSPNINCSTSLVFPINDEN